MRKGESLIKGKDAIAAAFADSYVDSYEDKWELLHKAVCEGYEQAKKDLALTWEDIERIEHYCEQVNREHNMGTFRGTPYGKSFYKEVARRFNAMKEEKR